MSLLIFSPRCSHSIDLVDYINKNAQLKSIISLHNINIHGIPPQYKNKIDRVPTMLTKNGKILVGNEIKNWLESLLPVQEVCGLDGRCSMTTLVGDEGSGDIFSLDDYGRSLQPALTPELQSRIAGDVSEAFNSIKR